jgi:hypothetical protein
MYEGSAKEEYRKCYFGDYWGLTASNQPTLKYTRALAAGPLRFAPGMLTRKNAEYLRRENRLG